MGLCEGGGEILKVGTEGNGPAGPYFVLGSSSNPRFVKVQDPCDLKEYAFDVLRLKRYHMGCTSDPVEIRSRDTAEGSGAINLAARQ
jgi:hypothetical protein